MKNNIVPGETAFDTQMKREKVRILLRAILDVDMLQHYANLENLVRKYGLSVASLDPDSLDALHSDLTAYRETIK